MNVTSIARLMAGSAAFNTVNIPTVNIFLQKSPGKPSGDQRGITGVTFQVIKDGAEIQTGTTAADGKVVMQVPGGSAILRLNAGGASTDYNVSVRNDAIEGAGTDAGKQRRLRMLGYHLAHAGADGNGVDGSAIPSTQFDRSVLEFQADQGLAMDGIAGPATQGAITSAAGA
jgi:peptidoglycan hydrolase-like protein with peptidoglycan-binding domain